VGGTQIEFDDNYTPLIKIICAPIYEYKQKHVSTRCFHLLYPTNDCLIFTCIADCTNRVLCACLQDRPREPAPVLPDFVVIEDKAPDAVAATTATVLPVPEDDLSAEDLAALAAIEQAYANRQQVTTVPSC
jgi:hypothetical protein